MEVLLQGLSLYCGGTTSLSHIYSTFNHIFLYCIKHFIISINFRLSEGSMKRKEATKISSW